MCDSLVIELAPNVNTFSYSTLNNTVTWEPAKYLIYLSRSPLQPFGMGVVFALHGNIIIVII